MSVPPDPANRPARALDPPNSRGTADDIVNQASEELLERERQRAQRKPVDATRRRQTAFLIALIALIPVLVIVMLPYFTDWSWRSLFEPRLPPAVARDEAQKTLNALVREVEAFREDYHHLPESLAEVGLPARGRWQYSVMGNGRYSVSGDVYRQHVTFESSIPVRPR